MPHIVHILLGTVAIAALCVGESLVFDQPFGISVAETIVILHTILALLKGHGAVQVDSQHRPDTTASPRGKATLE